MTVLKWVAAAALFFELPVPVYWLIVHPLVGFWRRHVRAAYLLATLFSWGGGAVFLYVFRGQMFATERAPAWAIAAGFLLLATEVYLLRRVKRELGWLRLVGRVELIGGGELATKGIYARVRHPRYAGMMAAVAGACLLAGSLRLWVVVAAWWLLILLVVALEERELVARFGTAYAAYSRRVPRFLPFRFWPSEG